MDRESAARLARLEERVDRLEGVGHVDPEQHTRDELDAMARDANIDPGEYRTKADLAAALNAQEGAEDEA